MPEDTDFDFFEEHDEVDNEVARQLDEVDKFLAKKFDGDTNDGALALRMMLQLNRLAYAQLSMLRKVIVVDHRRVTKMWPWHRSTVWALTIFGGLVGALLFELFVGRLHLAGLP